MDKKTSQQDRNIILIAINNLKKLFSEKKYIMFQKTGGSCPMTKCPKCGRVRVAMGIKADDVNVSLLDICSGRFENGAARCDYYLKAVGPKDKISIPGFGNKSARVISNEVEKNFGKCVITTNDPKFVARPAPVAK